MTIYSAIVFQNDSPPPINASALNHIQDGIVSAHTEIASQAVLLGSTIAYASAIAGNVGANASAIVAANQAIASQGAALGSLVAADAALATAFAVQSGAVASSTAALASAAPLLEAYGTQLAEHATQLAAQATQLGDLATTVAGHTALIAAQGTQLNVIASQLNSVASQLTLLDSVATTLGQHATQLAELEGVTLGLAYANRSGAGPVDLWDVGTTEVFGAGPTAGDDWAVAARYIPPFDVATAGVQQLSVAVSKNDFGPGPVGDFSLAVLDQTGAVLAWTVPTVVPSLAAPALVSVPVAATAPGLTAGNVYYLALASDDPDNLLMAGIQYGPNGAHLQQFGLAYSWPLASGLNVASNAPLPLSVASSSPPQGVPAIFAS